MRAILPNIVFLLLGLGCVPPESQPNPSQPPAVSSTVSTETNGATAAGNTTVASSVASLASTTTPTSGRAEPTWHVGAVMTGAGYGPLRIGMTREAIETVVGPLVTAECDEIYLANGPDNVALYFSDSSLLERVDAYLRGSSLVPGQATGMTEMGLGLGSTEADVEAVLGSEAIQVAEFQKPGGFEFSERRAVVDFGATQVIFHMADGHVFGVRAGIVEVVQPWAFCM